MSESLRDQLSAALEEHVEQPAEQAPAPETAGTEGEVSAGTPDAGVTTPAEPTKPGRTAGRERDASGRLLPGAPKKEFAPAAPKADATTPTGPTGAPERKRPAYPSTWKKGHEAKWDTADLDLLDEIARREGNFASGVSTYKTEYEKAKPFVDAVQPYRQILDQYKLDPAAHVAELLRSHHTLVAGSPQDKAALVARIIHQNQIPLDQLFTRGQDGGIYFNQQLLQQRPAQPPQPQQNIEQIVEAAIGKRQADSDVARMKQDKDKYPHFEIVRHEMGRLLDAGEAQDLDSAYRIALEQPAFGVLREADQRLVREQEEKAKREQAQASAASARARNLSPKSQTPTGQAGAGSAKGLRSQIAENFDAAAGGRF